MLFFKRAWRFRLLGLGVVAMMLAGIACGSSTSSSTSPTSTGPVHLGVLFSLTGAAAGPGTSMLKGAQLAADTLNQSRSSKSQIQLSVQDDQSNATAGVNGFNQLIDAQGVDIVVGPSPSTVAVALAPIANSRKVILMAPGVSTPVFTSQGGYTFRTHLSIDEIEAGTAKYATSTLGLRHLGMLVQNSSDAQAAAAVYQAAFKSAGGSVVDQEVVPPGQADFQSEMAKIVAAQPDSIYIFLVAAASIGKAMSEARQLGFKGTFLTINTAQNKAMTQAAGSAAEGAVWTNEVTPDPSATNWKNFINSYTAKYGAAPDIYAANAYDDVSVLVSAVDAVGDNPGKIKGWLRSLKAYQGVSGSIAFTSKGDVVTKPHELFTVQNGQFVPVNGQIVG